MHYINSLPFSLSLTLQELWNTLVHANIIPYFMGEVNFSGLVFCNDSCRHYSSSDMIYKYSSAIIFSNND